MTPTTKSAEALNSELILTLLDFNNGEVNILKAQLVYEEYKKVNPVMALITWNNVIDERLHREHLKPTVRLKSYVNDMYSGALDKPDGQLEALVLSSVLDLIPDDYIIEGIKS